MSLLKPIESNIELSVKNHNPKEFFQDRKGLWIGYGFENNILPKAEPIAEATFKLASQGLTKDAYDEEIEKALPEKHHVQADRELRQQQQEAIS